MVFTPHFLLGVAIASKILNPAISLPLAFLSHYVLDLIPHEEYSIDNIYKKQWRKSYIDFLKIFFDCCLGITIALFFTRNPIAILGGFLALLPDFFIFLSILFRNSKNYLGRVLMTHYDFHNNVIHSWEKRNFTLKPPLIKKKSLLAKFFTQVCVVIGVIIVLSI